MFDIFQNLCIKNSKGLTKVEIVIRCKFHHDKDGGVSFTKTLSKNFSQFIGLFFRIGKRYRSVVNEINNFNPDMIISDFEPYISRIAHKLDIPAIAINHQHFIIESVMPRFRSAKKNMRLWIIKSFTRFFAGRPDRIVTSSFHHFPPQKSSKAFFVGPYISNMLYHKKVIENK